jgi:hypothetical protein
MINKINKNNFSLRIIKKAIISLFIIALSFSAVYFLGKQIKKINFAMAEKKEMDYLISNREQINNRITTDFSLVDRSYQEKINDALPSVFNILPFVDALDSLAKKYSFEQTTNFSPPVPAPEISGPNTLMAINFNLNIQGSNVDNFISFLKDFERLPYFVTINNISYLGSGKVGWQENSTINISGSLYARQ